MNKEEETEEETENNHRPINLPQQKGRDKSIRIHFVVTLS